MKVGVAGLGPEGLQVIRAVHRAPYLELVAAADVGPRALESWGEQFQGKLYDSVEHLCADPQVEAVWVSTPKPRHCQDTLTAAGAGKHIVVEKPMALTLDEAAQMVETAEKYGVKLMCGHTASLMAANRAMRRVVASGELGKIRAINIWSYTDWMFRPRVPEELQVAAGGGPVYRQGPHQVDAVRLLGGGMVLSVRAQTGAWFPGRQVPGYYAAFIEFEDGTPAIIVHDGYGYLNSFELVPWAGSTSFRAESAARRRALRADPTGAGEQLRPGDQTGFGGRREAPGQGQAASPTATFQGDLGIVLASCESGDIRQSPNGLWIYDDEGQREVVVEGIHDERESELNEMYEAVVYGRTVAHDGRWGMATLEVVLAIMQSAEEHREMFMRHQCPAYE